MFQPSACPAPDAAAGRMDRMSEPRTVEEKLERIRQLAGEVKRQSFAGDDQLLVAMAETIAELLVQVKQLDERVQQLEGRQPGLTG